MKWLRGLLALMLVLGMGTMVGCSDDDDDNPTTPGAGTDPWVGSWVSEGDDVAPILVAVFNYDRVVVTLNEDMTVSLTTRVAGGAETTVTGVYTVTESSSGDIDAIAINYTAFEQEGIIRVTEGTPDMLELEVVQTVPDIGATPLTPADGFGADVGLGDSNIQVYRRADGTPDPTPPAYVGTWLSEGANIAPILVSVFNYDRVVVEMNDDMTISLTTRVAGGAETTIAGTYSVTTGVGSIQSIQIVYSAFEQEGIVEVQVAPDPDVLRLEVVQTVPDIGATPLTPTDGFGADPGLLDSNIQTYVRVTE